MRLLSEPLELFRMSGLGRVRGCHNPTHKSCFVGIRPRLCGVERMPCGFQSACGRSQPIQGGNVGDVRRMVIECIDVALKLRSSCFSPVVKVIGGQRGAVSDDLQRTNRGFAARGTCTMPAAFCYGASCGGGRALPCVVWFADAPVAWLPCNTDGDGFVNRGA